MQVICKTKNQHFLSQVEQRLNAHNPEAGKNKQRIYSFRIADKENYIIELENQKGKLIKNNMSLDDLFSFDVVDKRIRKSLELSFCKYEDAIGVHTKTLLEKVQAYDDNIKDEIIELFVSKLLNFFRNPYCIEKTLNTLGNVAKFYPLDPEMQEIFEDVENGRKPHQKELCTYLGISEELYHCWLKALFLLLMRPKDGNINMLEQIVRSLFENPVNLLNVFVFQYTGVHSDKRPLVSDRGFSIPSDDESCLAYAFNLCSSAFIGFTFVDIKKQNFVEAPDRVKELFQLMPKKVNVKYVQNELQALASYNRNVIYQAKEKVYCSSKLVYGL
jgi:hypothetical protein